MNYPQARILLAPVLTEFVECVRRATSKPRNFATSKYLECYGPIGEPRIDPLKYQSEVWNAIEGVMTAMLMRPGATWDESGHIRFSQGLSEGQAKEEARDFHGRLEADWAENVALLELTDASSLALRLWTSGKVCVVPSI